jgi:hypothetical protein
MTSTLGINDSQPRNLEAPRSPDLLPEQIRVTAANFITLLTEYYKFMNINAWTTSTVSLSTYTISSTTGTVLSGKSGSGPTNIIYSILSQLDVDQVDEDYLSHIQRAVAPYVPIPSYMSTGSTTTVNPAPFYKYLSTTEIAYLRAQLYRKIIKHFYNTRGSRNSAVSFFQIFYNDTASIYDAGDYLGTVQNYIQGWLTSSGMTLAATNVSAGTSVNGQTPIQAWTPFTYVITTSVPGGSSTFDTPYRALVHPVGFKYVVQPSLSTNGIIEISESRMTDARLDYQAALWFLDPTQITEYNNYLISDADAAYNEANQNTATTTTSGYTYSGYTYADWSNVGTINKFTALTSTTSAVGTYTLSITTNSSYNIVPGMIVTGTSSFGTDINSSATVAYGTASVNTVSGTITLTTTLSLTVLSGFAITFSP